MTWENKLPGCVPARHGFAWNTYEIKDLFDRLDKGWTITQLAEKHQRTQNAIKCALHVKETDLIINSTNYTELFNYARTLFQTKIELSSRLPYG